MDMMLLLIDQIAVMFVMIAFGFAAQKCKIMQLEDSRGLSSMALYVIVPCVLINAFQNPFTKDSAQGLLLAFGASLAVNIFFIFLTWIFGKLFRLDAVEKASLIYPNAGNLIVPMVAAVLGENWILYCSGYMIIQNLFIWTHGKILMSGEKHPSMRYVFCNSIVLSILLGIFLAITGVQLPEVLQQAIDTVGKALAPVCMFVTGVTIGSMPLGQVFGQKRVYLLCFLRLLVYPLLVIVLFCIMGIQALPLLDRQVLLIVFLASAAPSASNIVQFAQYYRNGEETAGLINVLSTLLCIFPMPLMIYLYQQMFG